MPRYENANGRIVSAMAGGFLERRLLRDGWTVVPEGEPSSPDPLPEPAADPVNLTGKTRAELNTIAAELGIDNPEGLPNIAAVKEAIEAA